MSYPLSDGHCPATEPHGPHWCTGWGFEPSKFNMPPESPSPEERAALRESARKLRALREDRGYRGGHE